MNASRPGTRAHDSPRNEVRRGAELSYRALNTYEA